MAKIKNITFAAIMKTIFFNNLHRLISTPNPVKFLLAVSGGKDSTVMAHLFSVCNLDFDIAHCNFHLREEDSNDDMNFVKALPFIQNQKIRIKEFDTLQIQKNSGKSIEMIARELRYKWFEELSSEYDYICTAHHANDNAETLLLNLVRGTGYKGINGIPEKNGKILRPMLIFSSQEIADYAEKHNISYQVDKTNFSEIYQRNKIRHSVLPILEQLNPDLIHTISRDIQNFNQQYHFYSSQLKIVENQIVSKNDSFIEIDFENLKKREDRTLILFNIINQYGFNASTAENILITEDESGKKFYSSTNILIKDRAFLRIYPLPTEENEIIVNQIEDLHKLGFTTEFHTYSGKIDFEKDSSILYVDADKLIFPLTIRNWKEGDWFCPIGFEGKKKKISDYFINKKIDIYQKSKIKILCSNHQIVWIIGYRSDERFKITSSTISYYKIIER